MNVYLITYDHDDLGLWEEVVVTGDMNRAVDITLTKLQADSKTKTGWELVKAHTLHKNVLVKR